VQQNGVRFFFSGQKFTLEDAIGSHACSLEVNMRVINGIHLGCPRFLPLHTVNCVQTLKVREAFSHHLNEVGAYKRKMVACKKRTERELTELKQQTKQLETWIASRTKWPSKVNETCQQFRDERIGIDLVMVRLLYSLHHRFGRCPST
jgi:hypothetical protein